MKEKELTQESLEAPVNLQDKQIAKGEIIIGTLMGLDHQGKPLVDFSGNLKNEAIAAISTVSVNLQNSGRQVALLFENNNIEKPVIIGLIHNPLQDILDNFELANIDNSVPESADSEISDSVDKAMTTKVDGMLMDGERVIFEARKEIVLKCGESSITLTKAGKILIKGKYLLNRSSGVNRIMGGSVQIN